jgi:hypothetical protein
MDKYRETLLVSGINGCGGAPAQYPFNRLLIAD